ncbi:hypothetical protein [Candidatus Hodarchaeum mangrovi]
MAPRKRRAPDTEDREGIAPEGIAGKNRATREKEIFSSAESAIIGYLKELGTIPSSSIKESDPLTIMLQKYAHQWKRGAGK